MARTSWKDVSLFYGVQRERIGSRRGEYSGAVCRYNERNLICKNGK